MTRGTDGNGRVEPDHDPDEGGRSGGSISWPPKTGLTRPKPERASGGYKDSRRLRLAAMPRLPIALLAAVLVVGAIGATPAAGLDVDGTAAQATPSPTEPVPGARLAGVVGVGQAELEGELEVRALGLAIARAGTADAKADIVADQLNRTDDRLAALESRKTTLDEARANGTLSESAYRARVARLAAETRATERALNRTSLAAANLPDDVLAANGVNTSAIETLQRRASELRGGEVAEIAGDIAGAGAGRDVKGPSPPVAGPPAGPDQRPGASNTTADR